MCVCVCVINMFSIECSSYQECMPHLMSIPKGIYIWGIVVAEMYYIYMHVYIQNGYNVYLWWFRCYHGPIETARYPNQRFTVLNREVHEVMQCLSVRLA